MSWTPQRNRSRGANTSTPTRRPLDGFWDNNQWWCNCEPRRKAAFREVKKESKNKGRFFFTCASTSQCGFFLWQDLANIRQPGSGTPSFASRTAANGGHGELPTTVLQHAAAPGSRPRIDNPEPSPAYSNQRQHQPSNFSPSASSTQTLEAVTPSKRRRTTQASRADVFKDDDDSNDPFSDLGSDDERQLAAMTDRMASRRQDALQTQTPRGNHAAAIDAASGLPTPSVARTLFPAGAEKAVAPLTDSPSASSAAVEDTTREQVMQLLRRTTLGDDVLGEVQTLLATAERKMQGLARGRDAVRAALRDKDVRIAELQESVTELENRAFVQEGRMREMQAKYGTL